MPFAPQPHSFAKRGLSREILVRQHLVYDGNRLARCLVTLIKISSLKQARLENRKVSQANRSAPGVAHLRAFGRLSVNL